MASAVPFSRRQRVTTQSGVALQRQAIYLPEATWEALQRLCYASRSSGSQVIENLIETAAHGGALVKDKKHDRNSPTSQNRA